MTQHARTPQELGTLLAAAWSAGDAAAYGELFTEDADYVTFQGHRLRGRDEIEKVHAWLFDGPLRGSRLVSDSSPGTDGGDVSGADVRMVAGGVAVMVSGGNVQLPGQQGRDTSRDSIQTVVAVERGGRWLITAFQNTRIQPEGS